MTETVERHISKPGLEKLLKAADAMDSATAKERQAFGDKLAKAEKEDRLDKWAFRVVRQLWKKDPAKAAFNIRALNLYIDQLGLAAQTDIEDVLDKEEAAREDKALVADVMAHGGKAALKRFEDAIETEDDPKKIKRELDKRLAEWPELTEELDRAAEKRLRELRTGKPRSADVIQIGEADADEAQGEQVMDAIMDDLRDKEIAALRGKLAIVTEEADTLRERLRDAYNALMDGNRNWHRVAAKFKLTGQQELILRCLYERELATKRMIYVCMYSNKPEADWGDPKIMDVQICRMRQQMPPNSIDTVWGRGYQLTPTGRAMLKAILEDSP